jgi:hypothetical protein
LYDVKCQLFSLQQSVAFSGVLRNYNHPEKYVKQECTGFPDVNIQAGVVTIFLTQWRLGWPGLYLVSPSSPVPHQLSFLIITVFPSTHFPNPLSTHHLRSHFVMAYHGSHII